MENRIKNVMAAVLEISADELNDKSSADIITSWDSLRHMNLVIALEEEFDIQFPDKEIVEMLSFPLIKSIVARYSE